MQANDHCLTSLRHVIACALPFAFARAGNSKPARIAMMAITTSNSIKVKPLLSALGADGWTYEQSFMLRCGFAGSQDGLYYQSPRKLQPDCATAASAGW